MTEETRDYLTQYARFHKAHENKAARIFYKALTEQIRPVIERLRAGEMPGDSDQLITAGPISRAMEMVHVEVGSTAARNEYQAMQKAEPQKADTPMLQFFSQIWMQLMRNFALTEAAEAVQKVTDTTKEKIREALAIAAEKNLTYRQTAKLIREMALLVQTDSDSRINSARAHTIARTEVSTAANQGKKIGAEQWAKEIGVDLYLKWWPRLDGRERDSHRNMQNSKPVPNGSKFKVSRPKGGFDLMEGPCDMHASPENRINCRCVRQYMSAGKAKREFGV